MDGGQILQSILWFFLGRAKSLLIAGWIGLVGAGLFVLLALYSGSLFLMAIAAFAGITAWNGVRQARLMLAYGIRD